jgi:hypothetical protein
MRSAVHAIATLRPTERLRCELGGEFVFVQEAAESVASANPSLARRSANRDRLRDRRLLVECAVRSMRVVVSDVFA